MYRAVILFSCLALTVKAGSNVIELTDGNFKEKAAQHDLMLIEFYAPWCGHCKRLAPEYEKAADRLVKNDPPVSLAKVDCTAETAICGEYSVSGYPTLKIFRNGEFSEEYDGPREADGIVRHLQKKAGPSFKELSSKKDFDDFIAGDAGAVVGFFSSSSKGDSLKKVADTYDGAKFGIVTDSKLMDKLKYKDEIVLFRPKKMANKFEDSSVKYTGDVDSTYKIKSFLDKESLGLCGHRTRSNDAKFEKPLFVVLYDVDYEKNPKGTNYWRNRVMKVGKKLRDEGSPANFAVSNKEEMASELEECGLSAKDKPVVCAYDDKSRKYKMEEEFSMDSFEQFVRDVLDKKLEPYLKSEPVPDNSDKDVKVAVGRNFDELVNNPDKDVLIEFYAPWCGHCKSLEPKYQELAEKLKDEPEVVIAKMDATANDVPTPYEVRGFPTIYFSPKGSKSSPKKYEGGREVDEFIKYLAKEATNELKGFDRKGKKKGGKKKKPKTDL